MIQMVEGTDRMSTHVTWEDDIICVCMYHDDGNDQRSNTNHAHLTAV
jgi:hypothetical protein